MKFKQGINPNQEFLFPKKPSEFLPENHLAKVIYEVVNLLDLSKIRSKYSEVGQNAYDPKMMVRILFYGYCTSIRSSRKISRGCEDRFDFVYLADNLKPSHDRIADFRKDNLEEIKQIFQEIVLIGANLGLVKIGNIKVSIDGSKVRANASSKLSKDEKGLKRLLENTRKEIDEILEEAEKRDEEEDRKYGKENRGDELPKKLQAKKSREKAVIEALGKLQEQKGQMKDEIRKEKGREPTKAELKKIGKKKINITDHDANFMKERNGVIKANYNVQVSVDEKEQFILANEVTGECNDQHQLVPMLKKTKENVKEKPKKVKADNGYHSQLEQASTLFPETDLYIDDRNRRKEEIDLEELKERYSKPEYNNLIRLLTPEGEKEYKKRMHTVEPVFGNIKYNSGYTNFFLRGLRKVRGEFNLMCIAHNLKKIASFIRKNGIGLATALLNVKEITKINGSLELSAVN